MYKSTWKISDKTYSGILCLVIITPRLLDMLNTRKCQSQCYRITDGPKLLQFKTQSVKLRKKSCIIINIRELNRVSSTKCLSYIDQLVSLYKILSNLS